MNERVMALRMIRMNGAVEADSRSPTLTRARTPTHSSTNESTEVRKYVHMFEIALGVPRDYDYDGTLLTVSSVQSSLSPVPLRGSPFLIRLVSQNHHQS